MRVLLALVLVGCAGEAPVDTAVGGPEGVCAEVDGPVTWDNFGRGFTTQHCQACHNSALPEGERQGAPVSVSFDTQADVLAHGSRILAVAASSEATMPPQGGVPEDDRLLLEVWLTCWVE